VTWFSIPPIPDRLPDLYAFLPVFTNFWQLVTAKWVLHPSVISFPSSALLAFAARLQFSRFFCCLFAFY